jgi:hypothetical protein
MNLQVSLLHRHASRSRPRGANGRANPPSSPGAAGARRWSVKVTSLFASHHGFAISRRPTVNPDHVQPTDFDHADQLIHHGLLSARQVLDAAPTTGRTRRRSASKAV